MGKRLTRIEGVLTITSWARVSHLIIIRSSADRGIRDTGSHRERCLVNILDGIHSERWIMSGRGGVCEGQS